MNYATCEKILLEFDPKKENLLPVLKKINKHLGFLEEKDAIKVAEYFGLSLSQVYETASFYDLINLEKEPPLVIEVCSGTGCVVGNSLSITREIEEYFHIKAGDRSNPKVMLKVISCLGQCGNGPVVVVNGNVFTKVTMSSIYGIIRSYRA